MKDDFGVQYKWCDMLEPRNGTRTGCGNHWWHLGWTHFKQVRKMDKNTSIRQSEYLNGNASIGFQWNWWFSFCSIGVSSIPGWLDSLQHTNIGRLKEEHIGTTLYSRRHFVWKLLRWWSKCNETVYLLLKLINRICEIFSRLLHHTWVPMR